MSKNTIYWLILIAIAIAGWWLPWHEGRLYSDADEPDIVPPHEHPEYSYGNGRIEYRSIPPEECEMLDGCYEEPSAPEDPQPFFIAREPQPVIDVTFHMGYRMGYREGCEQAVKSLNSSSDSQWLMDCTPKPVKFAPNNPENSRVDTFLLDEKGNEVEPSTFYNRPIE